MYLELVGDVILDYEICFFIEWTSTASDVLREWLDEHDADGYKFFSNVDKDIICI